MTQNNWTKWRPRARHRPGKDAPPAAPGPRPIEGIDSPDPATLRERDGSSDGCILVQREHDMRMVLVRTGARLHSQFAKRADSCSLAMLDPAGMVVSWYDESFHAASADRRVLDHHVSQFYLAADLATGVPDRHLRHAADRGMDTQEGWRQRPCGAVFWGTTVVEPIVRRDGHVLGFSHVTRRSRGPWEMMPIAVRRPQRRRMHAQMPLPAFGIA